MPPREPKKRIEKRLGPNSHEMRDLRGEAFLEMHNKPPGTVIVKHLGNEDIHIGRTRTGTVVLEPGQVKDFSSKFAEARKKDPRLPSREKATNIAHSSPIGKLVFFNEGVLVKSKNGGIVNFTESLFFQLAKFMITPLETKLNYSGWIFEKRPDGIYFVEK